MKVEVHFLRCWRGFSAILVATILFGSFSLGPCGCRPKNAANDPDLKGTWSTDTIKTEWGWATITLVFSDTRVEFAFEPAEGSTITSSGDHRVEGSCLVSAVLNNGNPMPMRFEGGMLVLQGPDPEPLRLKRR